MQPFADRVRRMPRDAGHVSEGIMDKRKVIAAYRGGLISVQECAQILGVDNVGWIGLIREPGDAAGRRTARRPVRS